MNDYIEISKKIKCPTCNSSNLSFYYDTCFTIITCRNYNNCKDALKKIVFITYYHDNEKFGQIFMKAIKNPLNRELLVCPNCQTYDVGFHITLFSNILKSKLKCHCLMCNYKWEEKPKKRKKNG